MSEDGGFDYGSLIAAVMPLIYGAIARRGWKLNREADDQAYERRVRALNLLKENQRGYQGEAEGRIRGLLPRYSAEALAASQAEAAGKSEAAYMDALKTAEAEGKGAFTEAPAGKMSDAYIQTRGRAVADAARGAVEIAKEAAKVGAPAVARQEQGYAMARTGSDLERIGNFAKGQLFVDQMRYDAVRPDPKKKMLGNLYFGMGMGGLGPAIYNLGYRSGASSGASRYDDGTPWGTYLVD